MKRFIIYIIIISSIVLSQDTLSTKTFGDSLINDEGRSVQQTTDGGYINTGWIESYGDGEEEAAAELAIAKNTLVELAAELAAAEKAAAEKVALEKAAQLAVDCQAKYDESTAAYEAGNLEANIALKREILAMGCDEELSSKAQYYIGWTYGNKLFDMDAAQAEYQKGANNYFSGLKYVEKCEEKLALYKKNDEAEAVYRAGDFAKAAALREEVGLTKGCDKELAAKNLYQAGYIHQKKLNGNAKAKTLYEAVVISFSGSRWVDMAKQKLATL